MVIKKPSVFIYQRDADESLLKEVCLGMEEEGVFFEVFLMEAGSVDELAWRAANDSMTGAGIGMDSSGIALQMKGLAAGRNVEAYELPTREQCRRLGANSARGIKKLFFNL